MTDKHDVRKGVEVVFADGETRTVRPLTIRALRKFVVIVNQMRDLEDMAEMNDEDIDRMVDAASILLEKVDPDLAGDRERLEDALDLESFGKLMSVAMGNSAPEG